MKNDRRDYRRWEPWMGYCVTGACLFACVALLAAGHLLPGVFWGAVGVGAAIFTRR